MARCSVGEVVIVKGLNGVDRGKVMKVGELER